MASPTAAASASSPLTGTTIALGPSRRTAGPSTAVAAASLVAVEPGTDLVGVGVAEEPQRDVELVRGDQAQARPPGRQPGQLGRPRCPAATRRRTDEPSAGGITLRRDSTRHATAS